MISGDRLAAYLDGDVEGAERERIEAALVRDPDVRDRLERIRAADRALAGLERPEPSAALSARLRDDVVAEAGRERRDAPASLDGFRSRKDRRRRTLAPVLGAAAAAAAIAVIGVSTGWMLRSAADQDDGQIAMDEAAEVADPEVVVYATANDYDETELHRLAVNVDTQFIIHPEATREEAAPLGDRLIGSLLRDEAPHAAGSDDLADEPQTEADAPDEPTVMDAADPVAACLPVVTDAADVPLVPVYVELASFGGEDAVIYAFVTEDPSSGTFRRVETWALARSDCEILGFAQYDRSER